MKKIRPEQWRRVSDLLDGVLDRDPVDREKFLDDACREEPWLRAEVEALLAADDRADDFLRTPAGRFAAPLLDGAEEERESLQADRMIGRKIGSFRIVEEIGRGGMAAVYLAERADRPFEQRAALKIMKPGMDTEEVLRRFQQERQILASLHHPHIAQLLDGGATPEGRPYLAMEYVPGRPIDVYCDGKRLRIEERLRLFLTVCRAVQFAHRNLVVHRDIKPSNVIVTEEGEVKLVDFGIAKLLDPEGAPHAAPPTRTAVRVMTPEYASPEQVRGQPVTTASDVYQLGLLLYELLTGSRPHRLDDRTPAGVERAICERQVTRPSIAILERTGAAGDGAPEGTTPEEVSRARRTSPDRLRRRLTGDLDNIVLMALRKEPERRYASVQQLMDDVGRVFSGRPVAARRDTLAYRLRKFIGRHRFGSAAAGAFILLLTGYVATLTIQTGRVSRERDRARAEAATALAVTGFLEELFSVSDPYESLDPVQGGEVTARELLQRGAERVEDELSGQPEVQARILRTIGRVHRNLGLLDEAEVHLTRSLDLQRKLYGDRHPEIAATLDDLAVVHWERSEYEAAEPLFREALDMWVEFHGERNVRSAEIMANLASVLRQKGEYDPAEALLERSLAIRRQLQGEEHLDVAASLQGYAVLLHEMGRYREAGAMYREALAMRRKLLPPDHPLIASTLASLARLLRDRGELEEAEPLFREALAMRRKVFGDEHHEVATNLDGLALLLTDMGRYDESIPLLREALGLRRKLLGEEQIDVGTSLNNLALAYRRKGDYERAEALFAEAKGLYGKLLGERHLFVGIVQYNLAATLHRKGDLEGAEPAYREALELYRETLPADHPRIAKGLIQLGRLLGERGSHEEAEPLLSEALAIRGEKLGEDHPQTAEVKVFLGTCLTRLGRYQEAETLLDEGYEVLGEEGGEAARNALEALVDLHESWRHPDQAERFRSLLAGTADPAGGPD